MNTRNNTFRLASIVILALFFQTALIAQSVVGFWEIEKVTVGDEDMTPIAKWTKIYEDGTYESGNGWLQNSAGTWKLDADAKTIYSEETHGIREDHDPFVYSFEDGQMIWTRTEEGSEVRVWLKPITELPLAPSDDIVGLWKRIQDEEGAAEEMIFFRWDRIYKMRTPDGNNSGYWHINAHQPHITILPHQEDGQPESWSISIENDVLTVKGISNTNNGEVREYQRLEEFPN